MSISLPLATESVRCLDFAIANAVDPGGTALAPDVVVLVEVPEPWPKPVAKHVVLHDLVRVAQEHPEQVRLLAAIPHDGEHPRAIAFRPTPTGMARSEVLLSDAPADALRTVLANEAGIEVSLATGARTMLVCTQGSHDVCCGTDGAMFADWAEQNRPDVEVFRVSHTGGHRFSPTAMTLPDGRMWAYLNPDSATAILDRNGTSQSLTAPSLATQLLAKQCRGWWGAPTGPAQVAERAVFAELGFAADEMERSVEIGANNSVVVTAGADSYAVTVEIGREIPTIACGAPGGQPIKPGREWLVTSGPTPQ